jgi:hypothetical protein
VVLMMRARDVVSLRSALTTVKVVGVMAPAGAAFLLIFGLAMAGRGGPNPSEGKEFTFSSGWLVTSYLVFAIMAGLGGGVSGRRLERLRETAHATLPGPVTVEIDRMRRDPVLAFASAAGPCTIALLLYLMTDKPSGMTAVIAAVVTFAVSLLLSRRLTRGTQVAAAEVSA